MQTYGHNRLKLQDFCLNQQIDNNRFEIAGLAKSINFFHHKKQPCKPCIWTGNSQHNNDQSFPISFNSKTITGNNTHWTCIKLSKNVFYLFKKSKNEKVSKLLAGKIVWHTQTLRNSKLKIMGTI